MIGDRFNCLEQQSRMRNLVVRGNEFLCVEGKSGLGSWGDTRISCVALWSMCECGLRELYPRFIQYCLQKMLATKEAYQNGRFLCFNHEVWDTSLALIAFAKGGEVESAHYIDKLTNWLVDFAALKENWDAEPWETLWAITALLASSMNPSLFSRRIVRSMKWVLGLRSAEGILISTHYTAFLLSALNEIVKCLNLIEKDSRYFNSAIDQSLSYLRESYLKTRKRKSLWGDQPWMVGHALLGIAGTPKERNMFLLDPEFNEFLLDWFEKQDWQPGHGWRDIDETSLALVGLTTYCIERESALNTLTGEAKADIRKRIASEVKFKFDVSEMPIDMILRPRWRGRNFKVKNDQYFILMPFGQPWSDSINTLIRDILEEKRIRSIRGDDMKKPDIIEDIWQGINESRIIIADCTGMNPNVLYELGIAHTVGKDVILLTQNIDTIAFDVRGLRYITYTNDLDGLNKLRNNLFQTIDEILNS